jgi:hypothetical protein
VAQCKLDFLVAENVTLTFRGFKKISNPWWLNRRGKIIGGCVEVDRWLQNFCSVISAIAVSQRIDFAAAQRVVKGATVVTQPTISVNKEEEAKSKETLV